MQIGSHYTPIRKKDTPWEEKLARWHAYEDRLTDLVDHTRSLAPDDAQVITKYREKLQKGIVIRKTCRILEKSGLIAAQIAGTALLPVLLIGSPPLAIAAAATLFAGMGSIVGSILWASKHPDNFVSGVPDTKTMQALYRAFELKTRQDAQDKESRERVEKKVEEFRDVIDRTTNINDYLPGISVVDGQVIISGVKLPQKEEKHSPGRRVPGK